MRPGRRSLLIAIVLAAVATLATSATLNLTRGPRATRDMRAVEASEDSGNDFFLDGRIGPGQMPASGDLRAADNQAKAVEALTSKELPGLIGPEWSLVGPSNIGGRVTDIAPDPTQSGRVFVAVATGGSGGATTGARP